MNARIVRRVIAGGLWLSMVEPGWRQRMDWDRLDMTVTTECVAGQVFGPLVADTADRDPWAPVSSGYDMLLDRYGMDPATRARLGFTTDDQDDAGEADPWSDLDEAWRTLWGPEVAHSTYPHTPGTLYDCPACELSGMPA